MCRVPVSNLYEPILDLHFEQNIVFFFSELSQQLKFHREVSYAGKTNQSAGRQKNVPEPLD
jgi:hypothetical protein